jgi:hypothetical protein
MACTLDPTNGKLAARWVAQPTEISSGISGMSATALSIRTPAH